VSVLSSPGFGAFNNCSYRLWKALLKSPQMPAIFEFLNISSMQVVHIGADHAGFQLKSEIIQHLEAKGFSVNDHGTYSAERVDYPDYAHPVATAVAAENGRGILICGSANGVCMSANKHQGIRAALAWNVEVAQLAREHNDANILCLPARFVSPQLAKQMVDIFIATGFEGGRHSDRVKKINC